VRILISVDVGYGLTKGVSSEGNRVEFPSVIAPLTPGLTDDELPKHTVRITQGDAVIEKVVGQAALESHAPQRLSGEEKPAEIHDILLMTAVGLLLKDKPEDATVDLVVGLPIEYYRHQYPKLTARLSNIASKVSVDGLPERHISFSFVRVEPQGTGAIVASGISFPRNGLVGLIDVGTYTTDLLVIRNQDGKTAILRDSCKSVPVGISQIYESLSTAFKGATGLPLPPQMYHEALNMAIQKEPMYFQGEPVYLITALNRAKREVAESVHGYVSSLWGPWLNFLYRIALAGGGAKLFGNELLIIPGSLTIVPDPVYANAVGYLQMLKNHSARTGIQPTMP
jgi:plasmid segregation protein ParM